jgi:hypothetical protein
MKPKMISKVLVGAALLCLMTMAWLGSSSEGVHFTQAAGRGGVGYFVVAVSLILPILGYRSAKTQGDWSHPVLLAPLCIITILPALIMLWLFLDACLFRFRGHVFARDAAKVTVGMSQDQVTHNLGTYRRSAADSNANWETFTFTYDVQRPWGFDDRKFLVRFRDKKVVSTEFRAGIAADSLTP